jgi:excisionase family DNA binding protein
MAGVNSQRMTTQEVADFLQVSVKAVHMAVYRGHLRRARHGRGTAAFDRADIEAYLLRRYRPGHPDAYWITAGEVAELLGVTTAWVRSLAHSGRLPTPVRHERSGHLLFRRQQLEVIANARPRDEPQRPGTGATGAGNPEAP